MNPEIPPAIAPNLSEGGSHPILVTTATAVTVPTTAPDNGTNE